MYSVNACDVIVAALSLSEIIFSVTWSDAQFLCYSEPFIFSSVNMFRNKSLGPFLQGGPKTENINAIVNSCGCHQWCRRLQLRITDHGGHAERLASELLTIFQTGPISNAWFIMNETMCSDFLGHPV